MLVLVYLCVHSDVVRHMQVPCHAILLSLAVYMAAVSSGMSMQRAKWAPRAGLVVCTAEQQQKHQLADLPCSLAAHN